MERAESGQERIAALILGIMPLIYRVFGPSMEKGHAGTDCTRNQVKAMHILGKRGPLLPSQLGDFLDMRRGSLTTLVDSLAEMGFVKRVGDDDDRRRVWIHLTEAGRAFVEERSRVIREDVSRVVEGLSPVLRERMERGLRDVSEILNELAPPCRGGAAAGADRRISGNGEK